MKFQEIEEAGPEKPPYYVLDQWHSIYQRCQPYLQMVDNKPTSYKLLRGLLPENTDEHPHARILGQKDVRLTNRQPKDTDRQTHDEINEYFDHAYGHPYRNGLFVTGTPTVADSYGKAYAIFPIGNFDFLYHPTVEDLFSAVLDPDAAANYWDEFSDKFDIGGDSNTIEMDDYVAEMGVTKFLSWVLDTKLGRYKSDDLKGGIKKARTEIMIWCESYYYMDPSLVTHFQKWASK